MLRCHIILTSNSFKTNILTNMTPTTTGLTLNSRIQPAEEDLENKAILLQSSPSEVSR